MPKTDYTYLHEGKLMIDEKSQNGSWNNQEFDTERVIVPETQDYILDAQQHNNNPISVAIRKKERGKG